MCILCEVQQSTVTLCTFAIDVVNEMKRIHISEFITMKHEANNFLFCHAICNVLFCGRSYTITHSCGTIHKPISTPFLSHKRNVKCMRAKCRWSENASTKYWYRLPILFGLVETLNMNANQHRNLIAHYQMQMELRIHSATNRKKDLNAISFPNVYWFGLLLYVSFIPCIVSIERFQDL